MSTQNRTGNEYVLITGASSGIGYEMTKVFAKNGFNLVLVSRNEAKLQELSQDLTNTFQINSLVIGADLSVGDEIERVYHTAKENGIQVDILINNAGFGCYGNFHETPFDKELQMINLNITALTHLSKLFTKDMVIRGHGKVLNVASLAGFMPVPYMAVYAATKAYVISFSHALASELKGTGITVSVLCPGKTPTSFQETAGLEVITSGTNAQKVAQTAYNQLMKNKREIIPGFKMQFVKYASLLPKWMLSDIRLKHLKPK